MIGEKEYALVSEKLSPRLARSALLIGVLGVIAFGLTGIGTFVSLTTTKVFLPVIVWVSKTKLSAVPGPNTAAVAISFALTVLLLVLAGYLVVRWVKNWQRVIQRTLGRAFMTLTERVTHLESHAADVRDVRPAVQQVLQRLSAVEPQPLPPLGGTGAMAGLKDALVRKLMGEGITLRSVGEHSDEIEPKP